MLAVYSASLMQGTFFPYPSFFFSRLFLFDYLFHFFPVRCLECGRLGRHSRVLVRHVPITLPSYGFRSREVLSHPRATDQTRTCLGEERLANTVEGASGP